MIERFRHAFAIDPAGPAEPTDRQRELVDRLCRQIVRRRLTMPAQAALEMGRPLNYLAAQAMHFLTPIATAIFSAGDYKQWAQFLERRGSVDYLLSRLEAIEAAARSSSDDQSATSNQT